MEDQLRTDFERARHKAFLHDLLAAMRGRRNDLLPFHELRRRLSPETESYRGMQTVPVRQIVGSMDRFQDFDRAFLPRRAATRGRWQNIDRAYYEDVRLPPIQLYKVGDIYFVKDGNHRVSVARERGVEFIDAEVIEGHVRAPLSSRMAPTELLLQAEYGEFLRKTDLDQLQPEHDIRPTALGRYDEIFEQIELHRRWLSSIWGRGATVPEAANDWYTYIYLPIVRVVRDRGVLEAFPAYTEADIYLWVMRHRHELEEREGHDVGPVASASDYATIMTAPRPVGERLRTLLGNTRSPDADQQAERRRRRLRRWPRPRSGTRERDESYTSNG
ncbi:MAG: transcriptional regulator [Chloroflexia bacterium]|nr:transcriptional regulator [Chloroflexia bacterium]